MEKDLTAHGVILFDGVCNLCNGVVQFIIPRDPNRYFYYAALQSDAGYQLLKQYHLSTTEINTFILVRNGKIYTKSTAALLVARKLPGLWSLLAAFIVVPRFLRDPIYDWVARNRYKWFGQKTECMMPTAETKMRFLD
ncbi:thiol-disulfide oxidoreductase DCC family protein [Paenibacillus psychroresistens]|uniref:Thiol-disulfide oxidoreductase DCC family protein n=1 Tax=Paenibacillus psychroresistens TaxID=1778678 RepID=A0A6B8RR26_9BACL|nr:thiol-disulfide oxidoreductase DCC family protein [Paenibacillus psychroresistens]QGQ98264.1 thiol-disulfide oxidoreductase DCC family protein [Paenibacillus psychroresistens]